MVRSGKAQATGAVSVFSRGQMAPSSKGEALSGIAGRASWQRAATGARWRLGHYTANTTEQTLSRMAPNTRVNTIMGHTNLNQWDIFMSSICKVAITKPVGAM